MEMISAGVRTSSHPGTTLKASAHMTVFMPAPPTEALISRGLRRRSGLPETTEAADMYPLQLCRRRR